MYVLMNKDDRGEFRNVQELLLIYELFSGTHDTPNLVQMLCNRRGNEELWFKGRYPYLLANFLSHALGILVSPNQIPLKPEDFTREFGMAVLERFASSTAKTFTLTLQDIYALLFPEQFGSSDKLTINRPSTSSAVGNPDANWSRRFPDIHMILGDNELVRFLRYIAGRPNLVMDYPFRLVLTEGDLDFFTFAARYTKGRKIVYQNPETGKWEIFKNKEASDPILEMVIGNVGSDVEWNKVKLPIELQGVVKREKMYKLVDIASPYKTEYERSGSELQDGLFVRLSKRAGHHFLVYEI